MADTKGRGGRPAKARGAANSSDAADARWTVRGVPANVRAMAVRGAAARGMTVGDWLAEAVVAFGRADSAGVSADVPAVVAPTNLVELLASIEERLGRVEQRRRLFGGLFKKAA